MAKLDTSNFWVKPLLITERPRGHAIVYRISEDLVAKFPKEILHPTWEATKEIVLRQLSQEAHIALQLFRLGFKVPRPQGIIEMSLELRQGTIQTYPAFAMEFIEGKTGAYLRENDPALYKIAHLDYSASMQNARSTGFTLADANERNFIWKESEGKSYFFDFRGWRFNEGINA